MPKRPNDGGPAVPTFHTRDGQLKQATTGLSLRDYFAAAALTGLAYRMGGEVRPETRTQLMQATAAQAYLYADAMLAERDLTLDLDDDGAVELGGEG